MPNPDSSFTPQTELVLADFELEELEFRLEMGCTQHTESCGWNCTKTIIDCN
jgi:hypothetical protein